jgi:predicted AAA+ superfamily ATPase
VSKTAARGIDGARIILGCLQPGQISPVFAEALSRLSDRLHYVNASGDKGQDATRFWFDTRANLRREMEDRKRRFDDKTEVRGKIADVLKKTAFKLCRMLLPGGETKQIEPYHPTAKAV